MGWDLGLVHKSTVFTPQIDQGQHIAFQADQSMGPGTFFAVQGNISLAAPSGDHDLFMDIHHHAIFVD